METGILDEVWATIDGVEMRVSIEAMRALPHAFSSCRRIGGFFYDDGVTREWVAHVPNGGSHSDIRYDYSGDVRPKVPPTTLSFQENIEAWLDVCHQRQVNPVLQLLDDGSVALDEDDS